MARTQANRSRNKNRIMNVRIADPASGSDGLHTDRMISAVKTSESQTRIVIGDLVDLNVPPANINGTYGFDDVFRTDDFLSMIQQYNLFRIKSIKFEIFDINPNQFSFNNWATWHDSYSDVIPAYSRANIADSPDARVLSGGTGQTTLYWHAHGVEENRFQSDSTAGAPSIRFGGLKYYIGAGQGGAGKYQIQVHAVVDFRGRR
jgi:hypothetical protein